MRSCGRGCVSVLGAGVLTCCQPTTAPSNAAPPARVPDGVAARGDVEVVELATASGRVCARHSDGLVACWVPHMTPPTHWIAGVDPATPDPPIVKGLGEVSQLSVGALLGCGLRPRGTVHCWRSDYEARPVANIDTAVSIAVGPDHACAVLREGEVTCWGRNTSRQLGVEGRTERDAGALVEGLPAVAEMALGGAFSCARTQTGDVWCWGDANVIGAGPEPRRIEGLAPAIDIAAGHAHACAVGEDHRVRCWGQHDDGVNTPRTHSQPPKPPALIESGDGVARVEVGDQLICFEHVDQGAQCRSPLRSEPARLHWATGLSAGGRQAFALTADGTVVGGTITDASFGAVASVFPVDPRTLARMHPLLTWYRWELLAGATQETLRAEIQTVDIRQTADASDATLAEAAARRALAVSAPRLLRALNRGAYFVDPAAVDELIAWLSRFPQAGTRDDFRDAQARLVALIPVKPSFKDLLFVEVVTRLGRESDEMIVRSAAALSAQAVAADNASREATEEALDGLTRLVALARAGTE
ncbi:MAG: hypothetical protein AAF721_19775 [Myxococcota bacterium]